MRFDNRVALKFMITVAVLMLVIYLTIYSVLYNTVYNHLENDLHNEASEIKKGVEFVDGRIVITDSSEWKEPEHGLLEINPIFIQIADSSEVVKKSPNLGDDIMNVVTTSNKPFYFKDTISGVPVYQHQTSFSSDGASLSAYVTVAVSLKDTDMVMSNLRSVLLITFPLSLLVLYFVSKYIAASSIAPVHQLMEQARKITASNYSERITLPKRKDELFILTQTINHLISRLYNAIAREKQFTSDASHELRTPLSSMKGSIEVVLRKERSESFYRQKLFFLKTEVDRMVNMTEQLLLLARYEGNRISVKREKVYVIELVNEIRESLSDLIADKNLVFQISVPDKLFFYSDWFMFSRIIENLIVNAIKYSPEGEVVHVKATDSESEVIISVIDHGKGIAREHIDKVFNRFYQADEAREGTHKGAGLGLSIVLRFCEILNIKPEVKSALGKGTSFLLHVRKMDTGK